MGLLRDCTASQLIVYSTTLLLLASLHSEHDCELNVEQLGTKVGL